MNLKNAYATSSIPKAIRYPRDKLIGKSSQNITAKPRRKYIMKKKIPKTSKNRTLGDF